MRVDLDPRIAEALSPEGKEEARGGEEFLEALKEAIQKVNELQVEADRATKEFAIGRGDLQETILALEKADISFRLMMQIRNKLIKAYEEVMKMPL